MYPTSSTFNSYSRLISSNSSSKEEGNWYELNNNIFKVPAFLEKELLDFVKGYVKLILFRKKETILQTEEELYQKIESTRDFEEESSSCYDNDANCELFYNELWMNKWILKEDSIQNQRKHIEELVKAS